MAHQLNIGPLVPKMHLKVSNTLAWMWIVIHFKSWLTTWSVPFLSCHYRWQSKKGLLWPYSNPWSHTGNIWNIIKLNGVLTVPWKLTWILHYQVIVTCHQKSLLYTCTGMANRKGLLKNFLVQYWDTFQQSNLGDISFFSIFWLLYQTFHVLALWFGSTNFKPSEVTTTALLGFIFDNFASAFVELGN